MTTSEAMKMNVVFYMEIKRKVDNEERRMHETWNETYQRPMPLGLRGNIDEIDRLFKCGRIVHIGGIQFLCQRNDFDVTNNVVMVKMKLYMGLKQDFEGIDWELVSGELIRSSRMYGRKTNSDVIKPDYDDEDEDVEDLEDLRFK